MPCPTCKEAGLLPSSPRASVGEVRAALDGGAMALCGCPQGQWWLSMIYAEYGSLLDRNGVEIGDPNFRHERGVPPGMLHGAEALAWLARFADTAAALTRRAGPVAVGA